jgi:hypothetical protein
MQKRLLLKNNTQYSGICRNGGGDYCKTQKLGGRASVPTYGKPGLARSANAAAYGAWRPVGC